MGGAEEGEGSGEVLMVVDSEESRREGEEDLLLVGVKGAEGMKVGELGADREGLSELLLFVFRKTRPPIFLA